MREGKPGGGKGPLLSEDVSLTLATENGQTLFNGPSVRRLTPIETERLMGWPDGWTVVEGWSTRSTRDEAEQTTTKRKRAISSRVLSETQTDSPSASTPTDTDAAGTAS